MEPEEFWRLAKERCTPRQYDVLRLKADGHSWRVIAIRLGSSRTSVRDLAKRAEVAIRKVHSGAS